MSNVDVYTRIASRLRFRFEEERRIAAAAQLKLRVDVALQSVAKAEAFMDAMNIVLDEFESAGSEVAA